MLNDITSTTLSAVGSASTDLLVLIGFSFALCVWGVVQGREVLLALMFGLYPAMLITLHAPYHYLASVDDFYARLGVFAGSLFGAFFVVRRKLAHSYFVGGVWRWIEVVVLSVCATGLFSAALYHVVDLGTVYQFSSFFTSLFLSPEVYFVWLCAPLVAALAVVRY